MRRGRGLSEEDARLWASVARSAIPMKGKRLPALPEPEVPDRSEAEPNAVVPAAAAEMTRAGDRSRPALPQHPQHPIERPTRRKLGKGRLAIEARIDLHEKTQGVAHYALLNFLYQAQAGGLRHVLVITGRGASFGSRGVLKRAVPHWFATPEFRALVSGFEPAERQHGGDGALYVRVRRRA